jgi:acyl carrier protein
MNDSLAIDRAEVLLRFINDELPALDRRGRRWPRVERSSLLFAEGLLDSLSILHLIARIEEITGSAVPDHLVVMRNFQSVDAIAATFFEP